jgi:uncharacterized protein (TIGR03067 family)
MKSITLCCSIALLIPFSLVAGIGDDAKQDAINKDLKLLEGTWEAVSAVVDGSKHVPKEGEGHRLIIQGNNYTMEAAGKALGKGTLKLNPTKKPRAIDLVLADGKFPGKAVPCIYQLNGDELRLCMGRIDDPRPGEFTAEQGSKRVLTIYRKVMPQNPDRNTEQGDAGSIHVLALSAPRSEKLHHLVH